MPSKLLTESQIAQYRETGFLAPIRVMGENDAAALRHRLEEAEARYGEAARGALRNKPHVLFPFLSDLIRHDRILDAVEDIIGPDILCWGSSFFIKDAATPSFVSWHQDSTYWGLSEPDIVTAWLALTPSTAANGAMAVIPGSHKHEQAPHRDTFHRDNLLSRGQEIAVEVDEWTAVALELQPGEMSLHHVRLVHGSPPNPSGDRRIGFAVRYIPTRISQLEGEDSATLVRGTDRFHHFAPEPRPEFDMAPLAVAAHRHLVEKSARILYRGAAQPATARGRG